jgi:cellulase (glycosyl hydrolase family 5)
MLRRSLITLLLALFAVGFAAPFAGADSTEPVTFEGSRDLLDDATWQSTLDEITALGARSLRVVMYWSDVAPDPNSAKRPAFDATDPSQYPGFAKYDRLLQAAHDRGMKIVLTVSGPVPKWATATRKDNVTRPRPTEFQKFMTAVGKRYKDEVDWWAVWNEPNHPDFLQPQYSAKGHRPLSPGIYRQLFLAAWRGLRSTVPHAYMLMGETAPRGTGKDVAPLAFLRGALCLNAKYEKRRTCSNLPADGYAHHAYSTRQGPFFKPPGPNDVTIGVLSRLTRALDRAAAAGAIKKGMGIYLTEFGVQSFPDKLLGVPLMQQGEYRSISEHIAYRDKRVKLFSQYLMRDSQPLPGPPAQRYSGFESGLRGSDGKKKPAYDEFRLPLTVTRSGSKVSLWGLVRPATGATSVEVDYQDGGKGAWKKLLTRKTDARTVWTAQSANKKGRRWRVVWASPSGTVFRGPPVRAYRPAP